MELRLVYKKTWRAYQARVLERLPQYLADKKFHLVAAPGSGKTTIGIEAISRIKEPALILVPSLTIKSQWINRIQEDFLGEDESVNQFVSNDLKNPKLITVATYQAFHRAMVGYQNAQLDISESDDLVEDDLREGTMVDLFSLFKNFGLGVLCLDECHHLKSQWWETLENFKKQFPQLTMISLTATPPYESNLAEWERYKLLCGDIDEEIAVPELVKEGSLCPHQDYLAFSYLNASELVQYEHYDAARHRLFRDLLADEAFSDAILSHRYLQGEMSLEDLFEVPDHLISLLSYLKTKGEWLPTDLEHLISRDQLPEFGMEELATLLQYFLFDAKDSYLSPRSYRRELEEKIRGMGLIENQRVLLDDQGTLVKYLEGSVSKLDSIARIVRDEFTHLGRELRLLILTDFIYKDYLSQIGIMDAELKKVGVLPIFEHLRRQFDYAPEYQELKLAVLCGSLVIIPEEAKVPLELALGQSLIYQEIVGLEDYLLLETKRQAQDLSLVMTDLFEAGLFQVLIGTKSYLGEGWDAPCLNSLILASTIGSFMLSNQMRGRAIRTWAKDPHKTSNIWHLLTLPPESDANKQGLDLKLLERRFKHFMGLSYDGKSIENGLERLGLNILDWSPKAIQQLQFQMGIRSMERSRLRQDWNQALVKMEAREVVHRQYIPSNKLDYSVLIPKSLKQEVSLRWASVLLLLPVLLIFQKLWLAFLLVPLLGLSAYSTYCQFVYDRPETRLALVGQALLAALKQKNPDLFKTAELKVSQETEACSLALSQATYREKEIFSSLLEEFFVGLKDQRYLMKVVGRDNQVSYYPVPHHFAANKKDAILFLKQFETIFPKSYLIYTRNELGREELLKARVQNLLSDRSLREVRELVKASHQPGWTGRFIRKS